jgi:hypothetical protein
MRKYWKGAVVVDSMYYAGIFLQKLSQITKQDVPCPIHIFEPSSSWIQVHSFTSRPAGSVTDFILIRNYILFCSPNMNSIRYICCIFCFTEISSTNRRQLSSINCKERRWKLCILVLYWGAGDMFRGVSASMGTSAWITSGWIAVASILRNVGLTEFV